MTEKLSPMQDELLKRADSIFDGISKTVSATKEFALEQIPDVAYQLIAYQRAWLTFETFVLFAMVLSLIHISEPTRPY